MLGNLAFLALFLFLGSAPAADTVINVALTNLTVCAGSPAVFAVDASGDALTYQWQVSTDGGISFANISDTATNASYTNAAAAVTNPAYQYQVVVSSSSSSPVTTPSPAAVLTVITPTMADAGTNQTSCGTNCISLNGSVSGCATGGLWASSGTGAFMPDNTTLNASYCPSAADLASGGVTLTLSSTGPCAPCPAATAQVVETLIVPPTASAITNQSICSTNCIGLNGSVGGCATGGVWTTIGTGTFSPDATTLNATYCPSVGDVAAGTVTLTLTSTGPCAPCADATAVVIVTINPAATASAGPDRTICAGDGTDGLGGSVGGAATGGTWTSSSGSGTFLPDATTLDASYVPSAADQSAGSVTLTLAATGQLPPCVASAHVVVTIRALPAITGEPASQTNCPGTPAVFTVTATGAGLTYQWQVSADGGATFANISDSATNASYTNMSPTLADNGRQYQVIVSGACTPPQTSTPPATLTIYAPATASVGGNQTVCSGRCTAALGGSVGGGALGGRWSSPTAGSFSPTATTLNATYCPSAADIAAGSVTLTLTTQPCGDAAAQVVVTINPTPAAPTTHGDSICSGGVANLTATSTGGALNWYADSGLTNWLATGTTYQPSPAQTTTYYVTETSAAGCVSSVASVTATVLNGPDTVNAGPAQALALSMTNAIQLAGSLANGATNPTWSGGSGTFSPNAQTTNALYTPSAAEIAAGSWALTLTASTACGAVSNTMSFSIAPPPLRLPLIRYQSTAGMNLCLNPGVSGLYLGNQCSESFNNLTGYVVIQLDTNGQPTELAVQDFDVAATGNYELHFSWLFGLYLLDVTASNVELADSDPGGTQSSFYPVYNTNQFTLLSLPTTTSGESTFTIRFNYNGTEYGTNFSFPLNMSIPIPLATGSIFVTNDVVWLGMGFTASNNFSNSIIIGSYAFDTALVASGPLPAYPPRALVWNNGAGTGNWNTNDANWNQGTAVWRDSELDGAIFTNTGVGTVTLTQPITPAWLWFSCPGYTIAGSSLALPAGCAITNDADAAIAAAITSGTVIKWGPGMLTLSGTNSYSGGSIVNGGTLRVASDNALGFMAGSPTVNLTLNGGQLFNDNASLSLAANRVVSLGAGGGYFEAAGAGNTLTVNGGITGAGGLGVVWDRGTVVLSGANSYAGATTIGATGSSYYEDASANPTLQLGSGAALPGTDLIFGSSANSNTAMLDLHGYNAPVAALIGGGNAIVDNLSGNVSTLTVGNNNASSTFSGVIQNTGGTVSLTKIGNGTLTLAGANTFTGIAMVNAGTLALSSSGSLAGSVSIDAGGTFDVSAAPGGYYAPASGASLTASGTAGPATLNGVSGGTVDLAGGRVLLNYDGVHPALTVSQSTLNLNGTTITVDSPSALDTGSYPLIQATGGGSIVTNGSLTVNGTAIVRGYSATLLLSGNQLILNVVRVLVPTVTTAGPFAPSQTYGSVILGATVSPPDATGEVVFFSGSTIVGTNVLDGVTGTASGPAIPNRLPVGSHAITATYGGDFYYAGSSSSSSSNLTVTLRTVTLAGRKTYDKTAVITPATGLTLANNVDGADLYLSPVTGTAMLAGWDAGQETITNTTVITTNIDSITASLNYNMPTRVQSAGGTGGYWSCNKAASFSVTLPGNTTAGNMLVAVINTDSDSAGRVSGVSGGGGAWQKLCDAENSTSTVWGSESELWYAPSVSSGNNSVTITLNSTAVLTAFLIAEAVVMEYSNVISAPLDQYTSSSGGTSPASTGVTSATAQSYEVWVAGLGTANSSGSKTLSGQTSGWNLINSQSKSAAILVGTYNTLYAYDQVVTNTGTAFCSANESAGTAWAGVIGTFKASIGNPRYIYTTNYTYTTNLSFALAGPEATNYALVYTGAVTIDQYPVTVAATGASKTYDGTTNADGAATVSALVSGDTYAPSPPGQSFASRNVAAGSAVIVPAGITISDGNSGSNYNVTYVNYAAGTISPSALTVSAAAATKRYDGTTNAPTPATITAGSIQAGDSPPVSGWIETYDNRNVGSGKTLSPAHLVVNDGNGGVNYTYTYLPAATGVIAQTNLTVTAASNTKPYDGTPAAAAEPTITAGSVQAGDTAPVWTETYDTPTAGTGKTLTPAGVVSDGNGGANYNYTYATVTGGEIDALGTTTTLAADSNPSGLTSNVTFTATVAGVLPTAGSPSGYVVFLANGAPFATNGPLVASVGGSRITASTASLPTGTNAMAAQYLGDGNYLPSTNNPPLAQVVTNNVIYSQTNSVTSIVNHHDGTFTLNFTGTPGAQYYLVASGDIKAHIADWMPVAGTTNVTASSPTGAWSCVVSNPAPAYYRPVAVNPAP
jgi:autotransporter-associated beta strand protein